MGIGGPRQEAQVVQDLPPHARKIKGEVYTPSLAHLMQYWRAVTRHQAICHVKQSLCMII